MPRNDRRKLLIFSLSLFAMLGGAMGMVWMMDPYNYFGRGGNVSVRLKGHVDLVLQAMIEVDALPLSAKQNAQVVIVGDSRARELTEARLGKSDGRNVLNLGIGGASFEETISFLKDQTVALKGAHLLIVAMPFERFAASPRPDRSKEARPIVANPMRYLANFEMLKHAWKLFRTPLVISVPLPVSGEALSLFRQREKEGVRSTWKRMYEDYDQPRAEARLHALDAALQPFFLQGCRVVVWSPPVQKQISSIITDLGLQEERSSVSDQLHRRTVVVDMTESTTLGGEALVFRDPGHTDNGAMILLELQKAGR